MSEDNIYRTFLTHEEIQLIKFGYGKEDWTPAIRAYMNRTGSYHTEARNIVIACIDALETGKTVISTGTTIKDLCKQCRQPVPHHKMDCSER